MYDLNTGATQPLANANVQWSVTDAATGSVVNSGAAYTGADGRIPVIDCKGNVGTRNVLVTVNTENYDVRVIGLNGFTLANSSRGPCNGSFVVKAEALASHLFTNLNKTYARHREVFGTTNLDVVHARLYYDGSTFYDYRTSDGELHIYGADRMIFGAYGAFVAAHEYGHKRQDKYWGGLMRYYTNACRVVHPVGNKSTFGCAFGEAFADWYAVTVRGPDVGRWVSDIENNWYYLDCRQGSVDYNNNVMDCSDDGSIVEGAVGAFLYDLTDDSGYNEWHDRVRATPQGLVATLQSCDVTLNNGTSVQYNGVDHLIFCIERRSPYEVVVNGNLMAFFNTRTERPKYASGAFISADPDDVRRMWLVDLYSRRQGVGTDPRLGYSTSPAPEEPDTTGGGTCGTWVAC